MLIIREGNSHFVVSIEYLFKTREAAKVRCYELASFPLFSSRISFSFKVTRLVLQGWSAYNLSANFRETTWTCWLSDVFHHTFLKQSLANWEFESRIFLPFNAFPFVFMDTLRHINQFSWIILFVTVPCNVPNFFLWFCKKKKNSWRFSFDTTIDIWYNLLRKLYINYSFPSVFSPLLPFNPGKLHRQSRPKPWMATHSFSHPNLKHSVQTSLFHTPNAPNFPTRFEYSREISIPMTITYKTPPLLPPLVSINFYHLHISHINHRFSRVQSLTFLLFFHRGAE